MEDRDGQAESLRAQLVTPEEPTGLPSEGTQQAGLADAEFQMPSVKNTRDLESEIMETIRSLQLGQTVERERMVAVLNRSITAISHWSLQAQLAQLGNNVEDRQAVETSLLRKEMEFLIRQRPSAAEEAAGERPRPLQGPLRTPPYSRAWESPRRVSKRQQAASPTVTLVESKKPHPRMRRTSDNPSTNEYVRVFHLRRK